MSSDFKRQSPDAPDQDPGNGNSAPGNAFPDFFDAGSVEKGVDRPNPTPEQTDAEPPVADVRQVLPPTERSDSAERRARSHPTGPGLPLADAAARPVLLQLSKERLALADGQLVEGWGDYFPPETFTPLVLDFDDAPGAGVLEVSGKAKYAEVLARKRLQERGELTDRHMLYVLDVVSSGNVNKVLYSVLPREPVDALLSRYADSPGGFALFEPLGIAYGLLAGLPAGRVHALALKSRRSVTLLVGRGGKRGREALLVRRFVLMGDGSDDMAATLSTVARGLTELRDVMGGGQVLLHWIELLGASPELPACDERDNLRLHPWAVAKLTNARGGEAYSALPVLVERLSPAWSLGPKSERMLRRLEKIEKWAFAAGALLAVAAWAAFALLNADRVELERRVAELHNERTTLLAEIEAAGVEAADPDLTSVLTMAESLDATIRAPHPGHIWNLLAAAKPSDVTLRSFKLGYAPEEAVLTVDGRIDQGLVEAKALFTTLLAALERAGFEVRAQAVAFDIGTNVFQLELAYPFAARSAHAS